MIYMDNAATTQIDPRVREVVNDIYLSNWGNASAMHQPGRKAILKNTALVMLSGGMDSQTLEKM